MMPRTLVPVGLGITLRKLKIQRPPRMSGTYSPCGTPGGYARHTRFKEEVCPECQQAQTEMMRYYRFAVGRATDPWRCKSCGSTFPEHKCGGEIDVPNL